MAHHMFICLKVYCYFCCTFEQPASTHPELRMPCTFHELKVHFLNKKTELKVQNCLPGLTKGSNFMYLSTVGISYIVGLVDHLESKSACQFPDSPCVLCCQLSPGSFTILDVLSCSENVVCVGIKPHRTYLRAL